MLVTFASRKAWSEHEFTYHRLCRSLSCHLCSTIFSTENGLTEHLQLKHDLPRHRSQLLAASSLAKSNDQLSAKHEECPLCLQKGWLSQREFVTHLGHHFEEIALSVLPREVDSDSDEHSDSDEIPEDTNVTLHPYAQGGNPNLANELPEIKSPTEGPTSNRAVQDIPSKSNCYPVASSSLDWDRIRGDFETLYCKSGWPLRKVREAIQTQHNFWAT
jgi:Clr5 domain